MHDMPAGEIRCLFCYIESTALFSVNFYTKMLKQVYQTCIRLHV